jgi:transcriptional regulator with XRE-family HTH domain
LFLGRDEALRELKERLGVLVGDEAYLDPEKLKSHRLRHQLTQKQLADEADVSENTVYQIEHDEPKRRRRDTIENLARALNCAPGDLLQRATLRVLTAVRGWPGVGKTSMAATLAQEPEIDEVFPDGVLWADLGPPPGQAHGAEQVKDWLLAKMQTWLLALGVDASTVKTLKEAQVLLRRRLQDKRILVILDDAWAAEHVQTLKVQDIGCAILVTTRATSVANALAPTQADIYVLAVLKEEDAFELLRQLAPEVVVAHNKQTRELARELEGLPLALQVAGRLLNVEASRGWGIRELLQELRHDAELLHRMHAPPNMVDLVSQTTPTVAALLQKSTDRLDEKTRERFAHLAAVASKPATFDLDAMAAFWESGQSEAKRTASELIDRGLLEPVKGSRFWMHALLVVHARSLCTE